MMKKTLIAAALVACSVPAMAEVEISGNVALTTDYRFRGISQTGRDPAVSGGFDLSHDSGAYAGIWGSNVQFAGSLEVDYYAGYAGDVAEGIGFDVGIIYYDYPGDGSPGGVTLEFLEFYGGISGDVGPVSLSGTISYSDDYFGESGTGIYYDLGASMALPEEFTLAVHYGYQTIDDGEASKAGFFSSEEDSYTDWSIGVSRSWMGLDFDLSYVDTDLGTSDCFASEICDSTGVFTISKSL